MYISGLTLLSAQDYMGLQASTFDDAFSSLALNVEVKMPWYYKLTHLLQLYKLQF